MIVNTDYKLDKLLTQLYIEWGGLMPWPRVDKRDEAG